MATATTEPKAQVPAQPPAQPPARQVRVVEDHSVLAHLFDTARFEQTQRIAMTMADASLTPAHLKAKDVRGTIGNCFQVTNQAIRWGIDPFACAAETYVVGNRLGYQGKLVAAVVNTRANLRGRLKYGFSGAGDGREIVVIGQFADEDFERVITLSVGQAKTANKMWTTDPDQKLVYSGVVKWARRHCPEVLLGVMTDDDLERMRETRQIVDGPSTEVHTLGDLTFKLNGAQATDPPANDPKPEESEGDAQPETEGDPERTVEEPQGEQRDYDDVLNKLDIELGEMDSVLQIQKRTAMVKGPESDLPGDVITAIDALEEKHKQRVRDSRGK